jgi:hypothetical protein
MHDPIKRLTPEQALEVVMRLSDKGGRIREAVLTEARKVLSEIDVDATADDVFFALASIDVHECWDRAGGSRDGYTSSDEAAAELIQREELQPFFSQVGRYHELGMIKEEAVCCMGVMLGLYRYEHESKSEFREWSVDIPVACAGNLLTQWRKRGRDPASAAAMHDFIEDRCPNWAGHFLRTGGRN